MSTATRAPREYTWSDIDAARTPADMANAILGVFARPAVVAPAEPEQFRPRVGRWGRVYLTRSDALAYEYGYEAWPIAVGLVPGTPKSTGWLDAEADAQDRADAMRERARAAAEGEL